MRLLTTRLLAGLLIVGIHPLAVAEIQDRTPAVEGAQVYFISPDDGATVNNQFTVQFGLKNMGVAPAGVAKEGTGHHHLLIDSDPPATGQPIPSDDHNRHFGGGQTETTLELAPGKHTLQLLLGDHRHIAHEPVIMSKKISITVRE